MDRGRAFQVEKTSTKTQSLGTQRKGEAGSEKIRILKDWQVCVEPQGEGA